ncbi:MAG TPA: ABC transporter substrate-binding protein [bacterium]|nr:ABC transporter substrate-binding protein [bacterium]
MARQRRTAIVFVAAAMLLAAGGGDSSAAGKLGGTVSVLGTWGGSELDSFNAMVKPFEDRTGAHVEFQGTRDLTAVLQTRIQGGNPPDVAALPNPGALPLLARSHALKPLGRVLDMTQLARQYPSTWLDIGRVGGEPYAIVVKAALKGLVWYDPQTLAAEHVTLPPTWAGMLALTDRLAGRGTSAWCLGLGSGATSGWPATDWIDMLLLRAAGPAAHDAWVRHKIGWDAAPVRQAWEQFGRIAANPKDVYGGPPAVLATDFGDAPFPMFTKPPRCLFHLQATFIEAIIQKQFSWIRPGIDLAFVPMPRIAPQYAGVAQIAGDVFGMFHDTPQARALMRYLVSAEAQAIWVKRGGALSPNKGVPLDAYPDVLSRRAAELLVRAPAARFGAGDMMPPEMTAAFYKGTLDYVAHPDQLRAILARLEAVARDAYK